MMFDLRILLLLLLLLIIPPIISIQISCYSNGGLILPSSISLYNNSTLHSCQCLMNEQNMSGFQYDRDEKSCYTFGNDSSRANIRVKINSQVCFVNQPATSYPKITTVAPTLPSPPIIISTSANGSNYYQTESIFLNNSVPLRSLSIVITVPKTLGVYQPNSYANFAANIINKVINETNVTVTYTFQLINGNTIAPGHWKTTAQFTLVGQARSTSNDTYVIRIQSYQDISGHFQ